MNKEDYIKMHSRNVKDEFKSMQTPDIARFLKLTSFPYAVCFEHWMGDFNVGTGIRNANAFNANKIYYIGKKRIDRRGAVGTYLYMDIEYLGSAEDLKALKEKYKLIGIDNIPGSVSIENHTWEPNTLLVFGEEGVGLTKETESLCDAVVHIDMYGSVRSLNCGTASGIVMHEITKAFNAKATIDS